jgi:hypothetical protein
MFYLIIIQYIYFFDKDKILNQFHKLSFFSPQKFSALDFFSYFLFSFSFFLSFLIFLFSLFSSLLPYTGSISTKQRTTSNLTESPPPCSPSPWCPSLPSSSLQPRLQLLSPPLPPLFPLWRASHGQPWSSKSGHGRLPWRSLTKLIFLCGMAKTDAYNLPLAIPTLNFI